MLFENAGMGRAVTIAVGPDPQINYFEVHPFMVAYDTKGKAVQ